MPKSPGGSSPDVLASPENRAFVLDSFALFAYFDGEEGAEIVRQLFVQGIGKAQISMSIINLGELVYATERQEGTEWAASRLADARRLPIALMAATEDRVFAAAHIKANYPVSFADAFAIGLAQELKATIVTGDPEFKSVAKIVDILWLREPPARKPASGARESRERPQRYHSKAGR